MANLKEIRGRIKSVKSTQQLTRAMKMVAAAKLRRAQDRILAFRPYVGKLKEIMDHITENMPEGIESPYTAERPDEKILLIGVSSNRGLCGAFNSGVIKKITARIGEAYETQFAAGNVTILPIGKKVFEFFANRDFNIVGDKNHDVFADLKFETVNEVAEWVLEAFKNKEFDRVEVVYNEFRNVITQRPVVEPFLPMEPPKPEAKDDGEQEQDADDKSKHIADYIFEPDKKKILEDLIPKSLKIRLYRSVLESNAGEQGARMTAMDSATENAEELLKGLKLSYNQARQAAITKEILEIVAGADALGG